MLLKLMPSQLMCIAAAIEKLRYAPLGRHGIPGYAIATAMTRPMRGLISLVATWHWNEDESKCVVKFRE